MERVNINVSAVDYDRTSRDIRAALGRLEETVHAEDAFVVTDSEFAFGWHFFVVSVSMDAVRRLEDQMGDGFGRLKGKGTEKKFLSWLAGMVGDGGPRFRMAIREEMESSKYGIF